MTVYRNMVRHTSTRAVAIAARSLVGLFLFPLYTDCLTPADYGMMEPGGLFGRWLGNRDRGSILSTTRALMKPFEVHF